MCRPRRPELLGDDRSAGERSSLLLRNKIMGSGTASQLFIAERAMHGAPEETQRVLAQAVAGREGEARRLLGELEEVARTQYVSPVLQAQVHAGLGEREAALAALEEALELKAADLVWVEHHPVFDVLRGETRLARLLDRGGLTRTGIAAAQMETLAEPLPRGRGLPPLG